MDKNNILPIAFGINSKHQIESSCRSSVGYSSSHTNQSSKQIQTSRFSRKPLLLTSEEAADFLGLKTGTLVNWRCTKNQEIPFIKVGSRVRYREQDLLTWLERQLVVPTGWEEAGDLS
jgi:excisionase family DNA binding protein